MSSVELHPAAEIFREWLNRGRAGCKFASVLASEPRLAYYVGQRPVADENPDAITAHIDRASRDRFVAIILFPRAREERDAARLVTVLARSDRWQLDTKALPKNQRGRSGIVGVMLGLTTQTGEVSYAMGFAPSGQMPTTRRGPYLGLALWAGPRSNPYFMAGKEGMVKMAHAPHSLSEENHRNAWERTEDATAELLAEPPEDPVWLRDVAFCLPHAWLTPE